MKVYTSQALGNLRVILCGFQASLSDAFEYHHKTLRYGEFAWQSGSWGPSSWQNSAPVRICCSMTL